MSVMTRLSLAAIVASTACVASASADLVVGWTMPTAFPTGTGNVPTGTSYIPPMATGAPAGQANVGTNTAGSQLSAVHALAASTYTSPAGNGSQYSFSSNNWSENDYYEARFSTVGAGTSGLSVSWDQARSSTGPSVFNLIMSVNGGTSWTTLSAGYTVLQSGGGGAPGTWSTSSYNSNYTSTVSLGASADEQSLVILRWVSTQTTAASGSNRIDSIFVNNAVPAPGAVALLGVAGLAARRRRR
jgi:hypothetical protein